MSAILKISTIINMGKYGIENEWMEDEQIIREIEEVLESEFKKMKDTITITWSIDDVRSSDKRWEKLTDEQCRAVLDRLDSNFDANYGICWETISNTASDLFDND